MNTDRVEHENMVAALAAFQGEMPSIPKRKTAVVIMKAGGKYSYSYADLADIMKAIGPILAKNGLAFTTRTRLNTNGSIILKAELAHTTGTKRVAVFPIHGSTNQEIGSSLTYARRYLLACLTGVVTDEDDDGATDNNVKAAPTQSRTPRPKKTPAARTPPIPSHDTHAKPVSANQIERIQTLFTELDMPTPQRRAGITKIVGRDIGSYEEMTNDEASRVVAALFARKSRDDVTAPVTSEVGS